MQINDSLKTWLITLKSQLFLGGALLVLMVIILYSLPNAEYEALKQYMKWQQNTEEHVNEDTIILNLDDASTSFLKKRFKTSSLNDDFYQHLLTDLKDLQIANVVLTLSPGYTYNTKWTTWDKGKIKITHGFPTSKLLEGNKHLGDERVGIYGQGDESAQMFDPKRIDKLYFPLVYSAVDFNELGLFQKSELPSPSMAISALLQRFNGETNSRNATWLESKEKTTLHEGKLIHIIPNRSNKIKTLKVKTDDHGRIMLRWSKNSGYFYGNVFSTRPVRSLLQLYQNYDPDSMPPFKGRTVVLTNLTAMDALTQGTVLHEKHLEADVIATAIDNIQQEESMYKAPQWHVWLAMGVLFCMSFLPRLFIRKPILPLIVCLTSMSLYTLYACLIPNVLNLIYPFVSPLAVATISFIVAEYYWRIVEEKNLRNLELNISQLVSKSVLSEIKTKKTRLAAGGKRIDISSMFVDIRNFTKLSENLPPKEVTEILNTWYTDVEEIANEYRGTVDKFLGDGALIMFGAPLESTQHADMALRAGRKMIASSEALALKWKEERNIDFSIGVAVNSGFAFVGFVGPKNKLEYTAIGDTVNTAARLQDQTKVFHTQLIFSENTLKHCQNIHLGAELHSLGSIKVRGKNQSIPIYTFDDMYTDDYTHASVLAEQDINQANAVPQIQTPSLVMPTVMPTHTPEHLSVHYDALSDETSTDIELEPSQDHEVAEKGSPAQATAPTNLNLAKSNPFSGKTFSSQSRLLKALQALNPLPPSDEN